MFTIIINTIGNKPAQQRKQPILLLNPFSTFFLADSSVKMPESVRKCPVYDHVSVHLASTGCTRRSWTARCRKRWVPSCGAARLWTTPVLRWSRPSAPSSTDWTSPCQVSTVRFCGRGNGLVMPSICYKCDHYYLLSQLFLASATPLKLTNTGDRLPCAVLTSLSADCWQSLQLETKHRWWDHSSGIFTVMLSFPYSKIK